MLGCSKRQAKPQTEALPTPQAIWSSADDSVDPPEPEIFYAGIRQSHEPATENGHLHQTVTSNNDSEASGAVIYSELQNRDNNTDAEAPSGDLYAQVQRR